MNDVTQDLTAAVRTVIGYINELESRLAERSAPRQQLINVDEIAQMFGVSRRTVADHWISKPGFPKPAVAPSRRLRRWDKQDIIDWAAPKRRRSELA